MTAPTDVVGTWRLISASAHGPGGLNDAPFGAGALGRLIYSADGQMMAMISHGARRPLSTGDRISASVEERAEAFATFFAYAGRYRLEGSRMVHRVEVASLQNWVGTDLVRLAGVSGNRLTLTTPPLSVAGETRTTELVWERM